MAVIGFAGGFAAFAVALACLVGAFACLAGAFAGFEGFAGDFAGFAFFTLGGNVSVWRKARSSQRRTSAESSMTSSGKSSVLVMTRPLPIGSNGAVPSSASASA